MKIAMGCDHAAIDMKLEIAEYLKEQGHEIVDYGAKSVEGSKGYPVYGARVGRAVVNGECELGILFCGTGIGIGLAANKIAGVRCATCSEPYSAQMARRHNNANVLSMGARVIGIETAKMMVDAFLAATPEGGRHAARVELIRKLEMGEDIE